MLCWFFLYVGGRTERSDTLTSSSTKISIFCWKQRQSCLRLDDWQVSPNQQLLTVNLSLLYVSLSLAEGDQQCCSSQNIPGVWKTAIPGAAGQVAGNQEITFTLHHDGGVFTPALRLITVCSSRCVVFDWFLCDCVSAGRRRRRKTGSRYTLLFFI